MSFLSNLGTGLLNAVTGGLAGAVGSLFGLGSEAASNAMSKADQKELMKYQYDLNMQGVENQRAYDAPEAQMKRLELAGLNPHLVYGSGSVAGNTSSTPSASLSQARKTELGKYQEMAVHQTFAQAQAELKQTEAQTNLTNQQASVAQAQKNYLEKQAENVDNQNAWWTTTLPTRTAIFERTYQEQGLKLDILEQNYKQLVQSIDLQYQMTNKQIDLLDKNFDLAMKRFELDKKQLGAQIRHWINQDRNASLMAKAAVMNAIAYGEDVDTRRMSYKLAKEKFDKFSDEQLGNLALQNMKIRNTVKWMDIMGEDRSYLMQMQGLQIGNNIFNNDVRNSERLMFQMMNSIIQGGFDAGLSNTVDYMYQNGY